MILYFVVLKLKSRQKRDGPHAKESTLDRLNFLKGKAVVIHTVDGEKIVCTTLVDVVHKSDVSTKPVTLVVDIPGAKPNVLVNWENVIYVEEA